jgi:hypothetical protein
MKVGDLVEWNWWVEWGPSSSSPQLHRGVIISERYEGKLRILKVAEPLGLTEVRAEQVRVISESR